MQFVFFPTLQRLIIHSYLSFLYSLHIFSKNHKKKMLLYNLAYHPGLGDSDHITLTFNVIMNKLISHFHSLTSLKR